MDKDLKDLHEKRINELNRRYNNNNISSFSSSSSSSSNVNKKKRKSKDINDDVDDNIYIKINPLRLSREPLSDSQITKILKKQKFIANKDLCKKIHEDRCKQDPMYNLFFFSDSEKTKIRNPSNKKEKIYLIDYLLNQAFNMLKDKLGDVFINSKLINGVFNNLMKTKDNHAKLWLLLIILENEPSFRTMIFNLYSGDNYTPHRLEYLLKVLEEMVVQTLVIPYNSGNINDRNAVTIIKSFLRKAITTYVIYTKDPRFDIDNDSKYNDNTNQYVDDHDHWSK